MITKHRQLFRPPGLSFPSSLSPPPVFTLFLSWSQKISESVWLFFSSLSGLRFRVRSFSPSPPLLQFAASCSDQPSVSTKTPLPPKCLTPSNRKPRGPKVLVVAVVAGAEEDLVNPDRPEIRPARPMAPVGEGDPGAPDPAEGEVAATGKIAPAPKLTLCKKARRLRPLHQAQERPSPRPRRRPTMRMTARSASFVRPPSSTPRSRRAITGLATSAPSDCERCTKTRPAHIVGYDHPVSPLPARSQFWAQCLRWLATDGIQLRDLHG